MEKRPPEISLVLKTGQKTVEVGLATILDKLGMHWSPDEVMLRLSSGDLSLRASVSPGEKDYPGMDVDGQRGDHMLYLGNFELPCETYPNRIAARLYAGYADFESDSPIALVTHDVKDRSLFEKRVGKYGEATRPPAKLVYVDHDIARSRNWSDSGEDVMPEHEEDDGGHC